MTSGQVSQFDRQTLMLTIALVGLGIVMLYSSSTDIAYELTGDHMYYLKRQLIRLILGGILFTACAFYDYRKLKQLANALLLGSMLLLALTLVIHKTTGAPGVARWLDLGPASIQPSDMARIALVIYLAAYLDRKAQVMADFTEGLLPAILVIGVVMGLIVLAPDYSTAILTGFLGVGLLFMGGARIKHLLSIALVTLPLSMIILMAAPYRKLRILTYFGLSDSAAADYQISQSLISLGNGGFLGQGLGNSVEKKLFLPAPHTDFVFAIIGEEFGFIGAGLLIGAFFFLFQRGLAIARNAPDRFGLFLGLGLALNLIIYVLINTAVVTEMIPNTGVPVPLISYGGTHLVFTLAAIGILLNISSHTNSRYIRPADSYRRRRIG